MKSTLDPALLAFVLTSGFVPAEPVSHGFPPPLVRTWLESGPREECVDILFVGDGYQEKHLGRSGKYWKDVKRCAKGLFKEVPFNWYSSKFNVRAVFAESKDAGCDESRDVDEVDTVLDCAFDTEDGRLLVFRDRAALKRLVESAGGADIVFVMVNSERYGGAGTTLKGLTNRQPFGPAPTYSAQDSASFLIAIHELGHSFAGLADTYIDDEARNTYAMPADGKDLDGANVTLATMVDVEDFESLRRTVKWKHFMDLPGAKKHDWVHEGGYYRSTGVYRPWRSCRMGANDAAFCPVCTEEVVKAIFATCGDEWDDAAYHDKHRLRKWRK